MKRTLFVVVTATALIGLGWSAGRAQTAVANFEISFDAPRGEVKLTCYRGCDWAREGQSPIQTTSFRCEYERCSGMFNGYGRITLGMPR